MGSGVGLGVVLGEGDGAGLDLIKLLDVAEGLFMGLELPLEDDGALRGILNKVS